MAVCFYEKPLVLFCTVAAQFHVPRPRPYRHPLTHTLTALLTCPLMRVYKPCAVISHCSFWLHSWWTVMLSIFSPIFWYIVCIDIYLHVFFGEKMSVRPSAHFMMKLYIFLCWVEWVLCIFWMLTSSQKYHYLLPLVVVFLFAINLY